MNVNLTAHIVKNDKKPIYYSEANYENLIAEMSIGQGEYLTGYAQILGCNDAESFSKTLQNNFEEVGLSATPSKLLRNVKTIIKSKNLNCEV